MNKLGSGVRDNWDEKSLIIVFSPHPDDETLGVGGTIAKKISEGCEVLVVVMTDGRHAFSKIFGINSDPTPEEMKEMRKKEVENALEILGVPEKNLLFLNFEDGTLEHNEKLAEEKTATILARNSPTEVYFTYSKDSNIDHRAANRIVRSAITKVRLATTKYQYSILQSNSRVGPMIDSFMNFFKRNMVYVDTSKFIDLKKAALSEYKSQITIISSKQKNPALSPLTINMHLRSYEVFYKD
jgi:LmbE family N-acetylglucosaminyl deacetylase